MELPSYSADAWMPGNFRCPMCGTESEMVLNPEQAFCTNDRDGAAGCPVLMFNPSLPDGGLSNTRVVDLGGDGPRAADG